MFDAAMALMALLIAAPVAAATQSGVSFVSGGIGENSVAALKAREKEFNLKLIFTLTEGNYLADVGVRITDAAGRLVVEHVTDGPIFMARLPAGAYNVQATYNGKAQARKISLGDRLQTAYMRWPADPARDVTLPPEGRETAGRSSPPAGPPAAAAAATRAASAPAASGVRFLGSEVGEDAEARVKAAQKDFNLKLVFTLVEGNYVADVDVAIRDTSGRTLLQQHVPGPFLLADLPAGVYDVTASYEGQARSRKVRVGGRLTTEYFRWPSNPGTDVTLPRETSAGKP
jgi:hypothetical protein